MLNATRRTVLSATRVRTAGAVSLAARRAATHRHVSVAAAAAAAAASRAPTVAARAAAAASPTSRVAAARAISTAANTSSGEHNSGNSTGWRRGVLSMWAAAGVGAGVVVVASAQSEAKENGDAAAGPAPAKTRKRKVPQLYITPSSESEMQVFAGNGNPALAAEVAMALGIQLGRATVSKFRDGESNVQIHDSVRGKDVFIIQSICGPNPNDRLIELMLMATAMRRASANRITAVLPYFAYARQANSGMSDQGTIAAADVALMLEVSGVDQVVTIDVHRPQLQGFFSDRTPVELLDPIKTVAPYFSHRQLTRPVIASPVSGGHGIHRATHFQAHLSKHGVDAPLALLYVHDKTGFVDPDAVHHRQILDKPKPAAAATAVAAPAPGNPAAPAPAAAATAATAVATADSAPVTAADKEYVEVVGDVAGRDIIIVDDMIDTGSRMTSAAAALKKAGAKRVFAYATHGLFTGDAIERINNSELFEIVCFNTVPLPPEKWSVRIRQLSVSALIAECIRRLNSNDTLAPLFN